MCRTKTYLQCYLHQELSGVPSAGNGEGISFLGDPGFTCRIGVAILSLLGSTTCSVFTGRPASHHTWELRAGVRVQEGHVSGRGAQQGSSWLCDHHFVP